MLFRTQVRAWVDRWLPKRVRARGPEVRRRARLVVVAAMLVAPWGAVLAAAYLKAGGSIQAVALCTGAALTLLTPWVLRHSGSLAMSGLWVCTNAYWPAAVLLLTGEGISSPTVVWVAVIPSLAALLVGRIGGYVFATTSLSLFGVVWALGEPTEASNTLALLLAVSGTLLGGSIALLHRANGDDAQNRLAAAVAQLRDEVGKHRRTRHTLEDVHRELVEQARIAGRAEIATDILHNVGNSVNWVTLACSEMLDRLDESRVGHLRRSVLLLDKNRADLAAYLTQDPKGRLLLDYMVQASLHLATEREEMLIDVRRMSEGLDHIKATVRMQQAYARTTPVKEPCNVAALIREAVRYSDASNTNHRVRVTVEVPPTLPLAFLDRHRVMQILVNLIGNAKHAVRDGATDGPYILVRADAIGGRLLIQVLDNGIGIPEQNLDRLFEHGFTTKRDGHGFGLHACVVAAREMGGTLAAQSDGLGRGACFELSMPLEEAKLSEYDILGAEDTEITARPEAPQNSQITNLGRE